LSKAQFQQGPAWPLSISGQETSKFERESPNARKIFRKRELKLAQESRANASKDRKIEREKTDKTFISEHYALNTVEESLLVFRRKFIRNKGLE
jgi:hypothetical protein